MTPSETRFFKCRTGLGESNTHDHVLTEKAPIGDGVVKRAAALPDLARGHAGNDGIGSYILCHHSTGGHYCPLPTVTPGKIIARVPIKA